MILLGGDFAAHGALDELSPYASIGSSHFRLTKAPFGMTQT